MALTLVPERRLLVRRASHHAGLVTVRLRPGRTTTLVDVSDRGIGVVTDTRIAPGSTVDVVFVGPSASRVRRGTVVHARVCALHPTAGARFRVGVLLPMSWTTEAGTADADG